MIKKRRAFICGVKTTKLLKNEIKFIKKYKPWGIILFTRNIKELRQVKKLVKSIKDIFKDNNYPILIDQEGGRVSRLNKLIDSSTFSAEFFGKLFKKDKKKFFVYNQVYIKQISYLLKEIGININTVPVLDVRRNKSSSIIGDRAFSNSFKIVKKLGNIFINQYKKEKIATVIKHIPGHGAAKVDSHLFTPKITLKKKELLSSDFKAFSDSKSLFAMTAHIIYKSIDSKNTATHSSKIMSLIRKKIKFKNIIISDDISMKSLKYSIHENTKKAFSAGCNLVLHCNAKHSEMMIVAENSPLVDEFIIKKTSQFYNFIG